MLYKSEVVAGALVLTFGVALLAGALQFPFLLDGVPGPGFLPLLTAVATVACGLVLLTSSVRGTIRMDKPNWAPRSGWVRVVSMLAAMTVSYLLLEELGFLIVTTLFMAAMIFALGERSWRMLATIPVLAAIALYAVFAVWLRVPLPKGLITFID
jgi:hypothetical protein